MRTPTVLAFATSLMLGCADVDGDVLPPPGVEGIVLDGDTWVRPGEPATWTVTATDLVAGDSVAIGWGFEEQAGRCPYRRLVGGRLCLGIDNGALGPARYWTTRTAAYSAELGAVAAQFDLVALDPGSADRVFLQALKVAGPAESATSNVWPVDISTCEDTLYEPNDVEAEAVVLDRTTSGFDSVSLTSCTADEVDWFQFEHYASIVGAGMRVNYDGARGARRITLFDDQGLQVDSADDTGSGGSQSLRVTLPFDPNDPKTYFLRVEMLGDTEHPDGVPYDVVYDAGAA